MYCLLYTWFRYIYLLETTNQTFAAGKISVKFFISRRTYETYVPVFQIRFQHIRRIHRAISRTSGTDEVVYFIDIDNGMSFILHTIHDCFQSFFKISPILSTGQQRPQIQLVNAATPKPFRDVTRFDTGSQSISERSLSHTGFTDMKRIILLLAAKHLYRTFQLAFPAYKWIMFL